jgi:hypothetical protein
MNECAEPPCEDHPQAAVVFVLARDGRGEPRRPQEFELRRIEDAMSRNACHAVQSTIGGKTPDRE